MLSLVYYTLVDKRLPNRGEEFQNVASAVLNNLAITTLHYWATQSQKQK